MSFPRFFGNKPPETADQATSNESVNSAFFDLPEPNADTPTSKPSLLSKLRSVLGRRDFQSMPNTSATNASQEARVVSVENNTGVAFNLVFGLKWRTLITSGGKDTGVRMAKRNHATHCILTGHLVGYITLPKTTPVRLYSASVAASKVLGGTGIFALSIGNDAYWIGVVRNGLPVNTDEIYDGSQIADVIARVRFLVAEFHDDSVQIYTDIDNSNLEGIKSFSIHDLLDIPPQDTERLQLVDVSKTVIPKSVMVTSLVGVGLLAAHRAYVEYDAYKQSLVAMSLVAVDDTPEVAWAPVLKRFTVQTLQPDKSIYFSVRDSINHIPAFFHDWSLSDIRCKTAGNPDMKQSNQWTCAATYTRTKLSATSEQMLSFAKIEYPAFEISFPKLDSLSLSWSAKYSAKAIDVSRLPNMAKDRLSLISKIQTLSPVLSSIPEFEYKLYNHVAPKKKDGSIQPFPANAPVIMISNIVIRAPLRSMDVILEEIPIVPSELSVTFSNDKSTLMNVSSVMAEVTGNRYAIQ